MRTQKEKELDPLFINMTESKAQTSFIIQAFMLKALKYGKHGMKIEYKDMIDAKKLKGKIIKIESEGTNFVFKIVNDPRN